MKGMRYSKWNPNARFDMQGKRMKCEPSHGTKSELNDFLYYYHINLDYKRKTVLE